MASTVTAEISSKEIHNETTEDNRIKRGFLSKVKTIIYLVVKKIFDIVFSMTALLFFPFLWLFVKILYISNGDFAPIIYKQERIGKNGRLFNIYKFRTMIPEADERLNDVLENDKELAREYRISKKMQKDPRVTKAGRFLRKTSLDEFPQFINVFTGSMSIVGNRPYLPREKEDMGEYYNDIVKTKCGIASYWAVMGRSDLSFKRRLTLERYYSNNCSLWLDTRIFLKAIKVTLCREGAK